MRSRRLQHLAVHLRWQIAAAAAIAGVGLNFAAASPAFASDPPVIVAGATVTYDAGGAPVVADAGLTITDSESTTIADATVSLSPGLTGDELNFANQNGITGSYDSSTGLLTLSGSASVADYQSALESITYSSINTDPSNGGANTSRTINWQVSDGTTSSSTVSSTADIEGPPPSLSASGTASFLGSGAPPVVLDPAVSASDADTTTLSGATVTISTGFFSGDTLAATTGSTGISASYDSSTGVLTLSGSASLADYNQVLQSVTFASSASDPTDGGTDTTRTVSWQANDGKVSNNLTDPQTTTVDVHDGPIVTAGAGVQYATGDPAVIADETLGLTDNDVNPVLSATVTISTGFQADDTLAFNGGTNSETFGDGSAIAASYNATTGVLSLTAQAGPTPSAADFQSALQSVTYVSSSSNPDSSGSDTSRILTWVVDTIDLQQTSVAQTSTIYINHAPPSLSASGTASFLGSGAPPVVLDPAVSASDADTTTLSGATVTISTGFFSGDTLAATTGSTGISASYDSSTGVLTLSGSASLADYNQVLQSVTFASSASDPTDGGTDTTRTVSWQANDGAAENATSSTVTTAVDVQPPPPPPSPGGGGEGGGGGAPPPPPAPMTSTLASTSSSVSASVNPSVYGQQVTFTAVVSGTGPTGAATFFDGSTALGTSTLDGNGQATYATADLAVGTHTISVQYSGDTQNAPSTSSTLSETVNAAVLAAPATPIPEPATLSVTSRQSSLTYGSPVTLSDAVKNPATGAPVSGGTVTFSIRSKLLCRAAVINGSASCITRGLSTIGRSTIVIDFSGTTGVAASTETTVMKVTRAKVKITASATAVGTDLARYLATVKAASGGSGRPSGTVTFLASGRVICEHVLVSRSATCVGARPTGSVLVRYQPGKDYQAPKTDPVIKVT